MKSYESTTIIKHIDRTSLPQTPKMVMTRSVFDRIRRELNGPPEAGGMLGSSTEDHCIDAFYFDHSARTSGGTYSPDSILLNRLLDQEWNPAGIHLTGFCHSHPQGFEKPSVGDEAYAARILECNPHLDCLYLPIVQTNDAGRFQLLPYIAMRDGKKVLTKLARLVLVDDAPKQERLGLISTTKAPCVTFETVVPSLAETFRRVNDAYDLARMSASRMIVVGTGGAASFVEDMVRSGLGEVVLIDPDTVAESNLATQHYRRADIGRAKVDCLAERLCDINPYAVVIPHQCRLDDFADEEFAKLAFAPIRRWDISARDMWGIRGLSVPVHVEIKPVTTLLCGLTDDFFCQSRINRLGLHFAIQTLCAQLYQEGRGGEVTFTDPSTTPACHRCILSSRYSAYLEQDFQNTVDATGCPLCSTSRLNSLKTRIALILLHHGSDNNRWGSLLQRIGNRNLIQIRMDPDCPLSVFDRVFGNDDQGHTFFDEPIFLPQQPEISLDGSEACPDCGGTGNLRAAKGTFGDTRIMRR